MHIEDETSREEGLTLPMEKGDVLLMHKAVPHRSTLNHTDTVRWSMDLRFQRTGTPSGRPHQPDFAVRSPSNPDSVLTDYDQWCQLWIEALEGGKSNKRKAPRWEVVP